MKKFLPPAFIFSALGIFIFVQFVIHGQRLDATKINAGDEKISAYESAISKIKGKTAEGEEIKFSDIDSSIVVVSFWASWCKPCIKEFPSLNKLKNKFQDKVTIIGINTDEENQRKIITKMKSKYDLQFESIIDSGGEISSAFKITKIPAAIVYYKGKIIHYSDREFDFMNSDFVSLIESKLNL